MPRCSLSISLSADAAPLCADLALLAEAADRSLQVRQRLLDLLDAGAQLVCVDREPLCAGAAGELRVAVELGNGLRDLVAAVRAGNVDGLAVEHVHGRSFPG